MQCRSQWEAVRPISLRQSTKTRRLNGVKSAFSRQQVPGDKNLGAPNPLRNLDEAFKTLAFFLKSQHKFASWMGHNRQMGKKYRTHISSVDCFIVMRTFQTWFHRCSTVSYCEPLFLRWYLVVRGNDNRQTGSGPHLSDVSETNWSIHQMLRCQGSDLGYHRPIRPSTGHAKFTVSTSRFLLTSMNSLSKLHILSPVSVGRPTESMPRHACNDIWARSKVASTLGKVIRW